MSRLGPNKACHRSAAQPRTQPSSPALTPPRLSVLFPSRSSSAEPDCDEPWEVSKPVHLFERCDVDQLTPEELTPKLFQEKYSLRRPFIVRNATDNAAARSFLANRCDIVARFGDVKVDVGDPFSLVRRIMILLF